MQSRLFNLLGARLVINLIGDIPGIPCVVLVDKVRAFPQSHSHCPTTSRVLVVAHLKTPMEQGGRLSEIAILIKCNPLWHTGLLRVKCIALSFENGL